MTEKCIVKKFTSSVVGVQISSEFLGFSARGELNSCITLIAESDLEMPDFSGSSPLWRFVWIVPFSTPIKFYLAHILLFLNQKY